MATYGLILEYEFKDGALVALEGDDAKFWAGSGLPDYDGGLDGFAVLYPDRMAELIARKIIRAK